MDIVSRRYRVLAILPAYVLAAPTIPYWTAPVPNPALPFAGLPRIPGVRLTEIYHASLALGAYNHAPMIDFVNGTFTATWKNSPTEEDQPGQRVLYSQSRDGVTWTPTDGTNIMFPNMSTNTNPAALFAEPLLHLNGRLYAAASPIQFCLYPDQYAPYLLLRRVYTDALQKLGPVFWASDSPPPGFAEATALNGVLTLNGTDEETRADVALLGNASYAPCDPIGEGTTTKCEFCVGGCQPWPDVAKFNLSNERTHYRTYTRTHAHTRVDARSSDGDMDVLLYRSRVGRLFASVRSGGDWSPPVATNIPDDDANLNACTHTDGRTLLVSNAATPGIRDPIVLSVAPDGMNFSAAYAAFSCTQLPSNCTMRWPAKGKGPGVQYPQSVLVSSPPEMSALYVIVSENKEDVWLASIPLQGW